MKKYFKLLLIIFFFPLISCNKSIEADHWAPSISVNKISSLPELFSHAESEKLLDIISTNDELVIDKYNKLKADQIVSYFMDKYKIDISQQFINNPKGIVILGMLYASKEYEEQRDLHQSQGVGSVTYKTPDENMNCFLTAIGDVIGISQAKSLWKSIIAGASEETVIAAVSLIGRRVAGAITITLAIYSTGECLGWW